MSACLQLTEALVADVQVPEVDAQVIRRDVGLPIRVDRDRVDMVGMGVGVYFAGNGGNNSVVMCELRQLQRSTCHWYMLSVAMVVLRNDLDRLFKHFPELDSLI